jgi:hypothetical protein
MRQSHLDSFEMSLVLGVYFDWTANKVCEKVFASDDPGTIGPDLIELNQEDPHAKRGRDQERFSTVTK